MYAFLTLKNFIYMGTKSKMQSRITEILKMKN